uniref:Sushi domain-containing protein n=1 Tax=Amphimedon queenslandica TaxID=400682 RepID=A0A1X7T726_AMPQE
MLLVSIVFLLSVSEVISQCPPSSGIYLRHEGNCYANGSYFHDDGIINTPLECILPNSAVNGGQQWIGPNGTVPCPGSNSNLICTVESYNILSFYVINNLHQLNDGWYKCCLPTDCSDPNTNIIFANIFKFAQIESFTVADLPSDMTAYPQKF